MDIDPVIPLPNAPSAKPILSDRSSDQRELITTTPLSSHKEELNQTFDAITDVTDQREPSPLASSQSASVSSSNTIPESMNLPDSNSSPILR